jgi:hypothetical protein
MTRARDLIVERGGLVALVTLALYVWLAPVHVVDGDNSEFATLSVTGGAAHPSGYPLYVLWLRALSWLPLGSPAHTSAIATAMLGAAAVLALHAACRAWGARPLAATIAVAIVATGPVIVRVATEAEVFALNNLVVATVLWLAAQRGPLCGVARAGILGLVAGLGLADHLTCALVAPVGVLGVVRGVRETRTRTLAIGTALAGLLVGLAPYLYLIAAPDTPMSWGKIRDLRGVYFMFTRVEYGGPTGFRLGPQTVPAADNVVALLAMLGRAWLYIPFVGALAMLGLRCARAREGGEPRTGWWMLALAFLMAGPLLVLRFNVAPDGIGLYVNQRFFVMPALLLAPAAAQALDLAVGRLHWRPSLVAALVATAGVVGLAAVSLPYVGRVHSPAVELGSRNLLHSLPDGAIVIHAQDELHAVTGYVQTARGERTDVVTVMWPLMKLAWYRERVARRGIIGGAGPGSPEVRLVAALLAAGKPVFVDRLQRDVIESFPTYPHGVLMHVLAPGTALPSVHEVFELNERLFAEFTLDYPRPGPDDEFATEVHRRYAATWEMIGTMLERSGDRELAQRANEHARALAPAD